MCGDIMMISIMNKTFASSLLVEIVVVNIMMMMMIKACDAFPSLEDKRSQVMKRKE